MNEIDEFLRGNKPAVKDDPTFLLETRRRLEAVEGIKAEVDRQRSRGRLALVYALAIGLAIGYAVSWIIEAPRLRRFSIIADDSITIPQYLTNRFKSSSKVLQII